MDNGFQYMLQIIGFRSCNWEGHTAVVVAFVLNHTDVAFEVCFMLWKLEDQLFIKSKLDYRGEHIFPKIANLFSS